MKPRYLVLVLDEARAAAGRFPLAAIKVDSFKESAAKAPAKK